MTANNTQIGDIVNGLCPGLRIIESDPVDSEKAISKLFTEYCRKKEFVYLDKKDPDFAFLGALPEIDESVGFCTLIECPGLTDIYAITYLVHPDFEGKNIGTALASYALDFSQRHSKIDGLMASVLEGSYSESIVKKLGFSQTSKIDNQGYIYISYEIKTD